MAGRALRCTDGHAVGGACTLPRRNAVVAPRGASTARKGALYQLAVPAALCRRSICTRTLLPVTLRMA